MSGARNEGSGAGTQTSAMMAGGRLAPAVTNNVELFDGTNWTETTEMNTARDNLGSTGIGNTNTAVIITSGDPSSTVVEQWNGSAWTEIAELNTGRTLATSAGVTTSGITMGGATTVKSDTVEVYNGSNWTEVSEINTARSRSGSAGVSSTVALLYGGDVSGNPGVANTE